MRCEILELNGITSKNSLLVACEYQNNCPFEIKRVFYICDIEDSAVRGQHANRDSEFLFIALCGSCKIRVDDGFNKQEFILDNKTKGLYLDKMLWKEMYDFSNDCVLLVLSNTYYNAEEYIYDYTEFLESQRRNGA